MASTDEVELVSFRPPKRQDGAPVSLLEMNRNEDSEYFNQPDCKIDYILKYVHDEKNICGSCCNCFCKRAEETPRNFQTTYDSLCAYVEQLRKSNLLVHIEEDNEISGMYFFKISTKFEALKKGAEELSLQKSVDSYEDTKIVPGSRKKGRRNRSFRNWLGAVFGCDPLKFMDPGRQKQLNSGCFTVPYVRQYHDRYYNSDDEDTFFTNSERITITSYILENPTFGETEANEVGLSELIHEGHLSDGFPLHDGPCVTKKEDQKTNDRQILAEEWSSIFKFYKNQPFDNIRDYFGVKIGLYFIWLGYYTYWLVPAALIGLVIAIIGLYSVSLDNNPIAHEVCNEANRLNLYMCPLCHETCDFWYYNSECVSARFSLLFDNGGTIFFAAFMALWGCLFIEFWKRKLVFLKYEWDTIDFELEEKPLAKFLNLAKKYSIRKPKPRSPSPPPASLLDQDDSPPLTDTPTTTSNSGKKNSGLESIKDAYYHRYNIYESELGYYSSNQNHYYESSWTFLSRLALVVSIVLTFVAALIGIIVSIIMYRVAVNLATYRVVADISGGFTGAGYIVSFTALILQVSSIFIMNIIYGYLAGYLTAWEVQRTTTDYERSYTMKMYLFYFINFYASIFYIAFIKGKFIGVPGDLNRIGSLPLESCTAEGCQLELARQLFIIFLSFLFKNNSFEIGSLYGKKVWLSRRRCSLKKKNTPEDQQVIEEEELQDGSLKDETEVDLVDEPEEKEGEESGQEKEEEKTKEKEEEMEPKEEEEKERKEEERGDKDEGKMAEEVEIDLSSHSSTEGVLPPSWKDDDMLVPTNGMVSVGKHSLFFEYLDIVIQYGFVTIFVAAFPLAPLMALLNNIFEIRLDAYKFVKILRRPVPERTDDQATWVSILELVTSLSVITNGLILAFTSTFIERQIYHYVYRDGALDDSSCIGNDCSNAGFVSWSSSLFNMSALLKPISNTDSRTDFPLLHILNLPQYSNGSVVERVSLLGKDKGKVQPVLYLPFFDFDCLSQFIKGFELLNFTESEFMYYQEDPEFQNLTLSTAGGGRDDDILSETGVCFNEEIQCRFRAQREADGTRPSKYWRTLAAKLALAILFENIIFIISIVVCFIIPKTPFSVHMERRLEKKLTRNFWKGKAKLL